MSGEGKHHLCPHLVLQDLTLTVFVLFLRVCCSVSHRSPHQRHSQVRNANTAYNPPHVVPSLSQFLSSFSLYSCSSSSNPVSSQLFFFFITAAERRWTVAAELGLRTELHPSVQRQGRVFYLRPPLRWLFSPKPRGQSKRDTSNGAKNPPRH